MTNELTVVPWKLKAILMLTAIVLIVLGSGLMFATHLMAILYWTPESLSGTNGARTADAVIVALGSLAWVGTRQEIRVLATVITVLFVWFVLKSVAVYLALARPTGVSKTPVSLSPFYRRSLMVTSFSFRGLPLTDVTGP